MVFGMKVFAEHRIDLCCQNGNQHIFNDGGGKNENEFKGIEMILRELIGVMILRKELFCENEGFICIPEK